jgi:putative heme-binding domain-containing protein
LRSTILDTLLSRTTWTQELLKAIEQQRLPAAHLDAARRQQLLGHRLPDIRETAEKLLQASASGSRAEVLEQFAAARELQGQAARGRPLFTKHCANCHRLEEAGHAVGPDLTALSDRSVDALMVAILDPNRAVEDKFLEYLAVTNDGLIQRGMLASESSNSITLVAQEAKQFSLLRAALESLSTTGKSMMPEGIEKEISPQDLADLLAYVRSVEGQPKSFPGNEPKTPHVRDDGSLRLLATDCRIYGPFVVFEPLYRNLGYWGSPHDRAVWDMQVPKAGRYRVVVDYACQDGTAGNRFLVEVAGQTLSGEVRGTGTWNQYRRMTAGEVSLPEGAASLTFRSDGAINGFLLDLREIVLAPLP